MRVDTQHSLSRFNLTVEPEVEAAVVAIGDARQSRQLAAQQRLDAQRERIAQSRAAADELRKIATMNAIGGVIQGVLGIASGAATVVGCIGNRSEMIKGKQELTKLARATDGISAASRALAACDPSRIVIAHQEVNRKELEIGAETAGMRADKEQDNQQEANRLQGALTQQLGKLLEAQHALRMAATPRD